ncbi:hypothetical protein B7P43_G11534 [Cryptotermes secundus]|uniref:Uncharacterized protein n=1 Tax=Cryptotermes secundus TaxID=105785 RepID=A0A2J7Q9N4_9NEOP|nr:hypothetical protein B7P43_G11534 [Cryptotermes secundus]
MPYIILRVRWCDIVVLNVHGPSQDKIDDMKDRFYEGLQHVFDNFPKYHMKILLRRHSSILDVQSSDCDTDHYRVVEKVRKRPAVSKQTTHRVHMERFNLKKLNEIEGKGQYRTEISNSFAALENLDTEVDISRAWKSIRQNIARKKYEYYGFVYERISVSHFTHSTTEYYNEKLHRNCITQ